jgi:hypothetical protein
MDHERPGSGKLQGLCKKEDAGTSVQSLPSNDLGCAADVAVQEQPLHGRGSARIPIDLRAKKPSSSSRLVGAGSGAPGPSFVVGSLT